MKKLNLELTEKEVEIIFKALGERPFNEVYTLIGNINAQVNAQYQNDQEADESALQSNHKH